MTAYVGLAALSGHLSPLARGPLLDGIGPPQDYRWVSPPPDLAANNQPPSSGVFPIPFDPNGSRPATPVTSDNQVTVIVPEGAFATKAGQIEVTLTIDPVDPATLGSPGAGVTIFGNAYRLDATYEPSGDRAKLVLPLDVVLIYPVTPNLHASVHQLYTSPDGQTWTAQEGSDSLAQQQAEGPVPELGYVMVAGEAGAVARHAVRRLERLVEHGDHPDRRSRRAWGWSGSADRPGAAAPTSLRRTSRRRRPAADTG